MLKSIFTVSLLLIGLCSQVWADTDDLLHYDLSLGGYQLGMSYQDAVMVRPFVSIGTHDSDGPILPDITWGVVDQVFVDGVEFRFKVEFIDDRAYKIIGRFPPSQLKELRERLVATLGEGESKTKVLNSETGIESLMVHELWSFPNSRIDLVGVETKTDFATLSLLATDRAVEERREKFLQLMHEKHAALK